MSLSRLDWTDIERRAHGAYLGLAVGDALGATVEFMTESEIQRTHGIHRHMIGGGWLRLKPGQVTDDTGMTLALGRAIIACPRWELKAVADSFLAWFQSRPVDVGNTCRRGILRYRHDASLVAAFSEGDAGNGAAMRNFPVSLATLGDPERLERWTLEQCRFTHNHPLSDAATLALAHMTQALLLGAPKVAVRALADDLVARIRTFRFDPYPRRNTPYVVDTLQTVWHAFFAADGLEECLVKTVNLGGDADTTGALAGMLAGALHGPEAIPARWMRRLQPTVRGAIAEQVPKLVRIARERTRVSE